jgi:flagellar biosynthesis protein FliQ
MDATTAIALGRQVLLEALTIVAPLLGVSLVVGIVIALFQALTSLQEQTVAMVPKLLALGGALFVLLPWILGQLTDFAQRVLCNLGRLGVGA